MLKIDLIKTFGDLKKAKYQPKTIKEEIRQNLIIKLKNKEEVFAGIWGFEETVIPELERALLSKHNINLLGLRGQAKTRLARLMVYLLDEYIPIVAGSDLNDDPFDPISNYAINLIKEKGDQSPIEWLHRDQRYNEKLATPDVSIADLIGDVDPIKAATLKLPYSDERVIHYGLIPRSNRSIFVINELPDLQARIQVALFNILQEGDLQIRGFKLRLPLDIQFIFTANPEDYTNRGSIVTPLKDRIDSQIVTHYPKSIEIGRKITQQEALLKKEQEVIGVHDGLKNLIEIVAVEARKSEYVDHKSGVSARMTISTFENLLSAAERRMLVNNESKTFARISDIYGAIPSINGKIELVYEGEVEGPVYVAQSLISKAIRTLYLNYFPDPETTKKNPVNPTKETTEWFAQNNEINLENNSSDKEHIANLKSIKGLEKFVETYQKTAKKEEKYFLMELALHGFAEYSLISKSNLDNGQSFKDLFSSILNQ